MQNLKTKGQEMDVADLDEAQSKKVFRARKTMKISDRQQLESIHNSHSSSALPSSSAASCSSTPPPTVLNGKHPEEEQTETHKVRESHTDNNTKETCSTPPVPRTPSPLTLSLSLSPSPPSQSPEKRSHSNACLSPAHSPNSVGKERDGKESNGKERDDGEEKERSSLLGGVEAGDDKKTEEGEVKEKEDSAGSQAKDKEDENPKPDGDVSSPLDSSQDPTVSAVSPLASETKDKENKIETEKRTESEEAVAMDTDPAPMEMKALEVNKSTPAADAISSTSPSLSPSHVPESDLEVKEGFLVLSEEDDNQGEKDEEKVKEEVKIEGGEEMEMEVDVKKEVDMKTEEDKKDNRDTAPPSPTSSPAPPPSADPEADKCRTILSGKKRALCGDSETDREKEKGEEEGVVRDGKRLKVEGDELEAQLELKIRADTSSRLKLEKVVQQLVEEQLRVLQLSVFDRSLQELRERVEKIDCATKHQQTLNTLQAKISRLAKKFGAANQTKENIRKPQEGTSLTPATNTVPTSTTSTTSTFRPVWTTVDSKPTNLKPTAHPLNSTAFLAQPKPLSTPTPPASSPMVSAPVPLLITTTAASGTTSSISSLAPVTSQNQTGTLLLKTTLANNAVTQSAPMSAPQSVSLQPLLIQLPLAVTSAQGGSVVTNHNAGVELIPVSSLGTVSKLNKAKTTTATTFILQKTTPSSSASSLPPSSSLPQITLARAVYPGGSGIVSVPSSGVSVSTARTPTQCVSVVGVTSSSSLPVSSAPAATGGQATVGPPSATVMASKTDNQATNSAASKPSAQISRASSSRAVIDLTEDDDDVQVTGVQKAPVQSGHNAASSVSPATQHSTGAPPPLISSTTQLGPEASDRTLSLSQGFPPLSKHLLPFTLLVNMAAKEKSGSTIRSSPQGGLHLVNGPPVAVPYRSPQNSPSKIRPANPLHQLPPLPSLPPAPTRLPPEAAHTSLPQQPQLKLTRVQNQNGIVLSWCVEETDRTCAAVDSYHLYAYHRDHASVPQSQWKKIGEVKALPLPMACTLTQFVSGSTYYFAVCARDIYSRFGSFCEPQCTDVISSSPSS